MKRIFALLLVCLLACPCALADTEYHLEDSGLYITVPDTMPEQDISDEDNEDLILLCANSEKTLLMMVFVHEAEGITLDDLLAAQPEDETVSSYGVTVINGVKTLYAVSNDDGDQYVTYYYAADDLVTSFVFWYENDEAASLSGEIMATLEK